MTNPTLKFAISGILSCIWTLGIWALLLWADFSPRVANGIGTIVFVATFFLFLWMFAAVSVSGRDADEERARHPGRQI